MTRKLLVCGSAGFLMSNFMRYLLYRSKDYEIASVDRLTRAEDHKRVYIHRNHNFYLGDVTDKEFMTRLISIEKPDVIVNGIGCNDKRSDQFAHIDCVNAVASVLESAGGIPVVQLTHGVGQDAFGVGRVIANLTFDKPQNTLIAVHNCFGFRQRPDTGLAYVLWRMLQHASGLTIPDSAVWPSSWTYAEDVASLIWFAIDQNRTGEIHMPTLGRIVADDLGKLLSDTLGVPYGIEERQINAFEHGSDSIWAAMQMSSDGNETSVDGWKPDSVSLKDSLTKTARWYQANKWALIP